MTADAAAGGPARARPRRLLEPWFAPFGLINGAAVGLAPILLPVVAVRYGVGHVGLVMGAFNLGAFAAPLTGGLADRYHAYRVLAIACAAPPASVPPAPAPQASPAPSTPQAPPNPEPAAP